MVRERLYAVKFIRVLCGMSTCILKPADAVRAVLDARLPLRLYGRCVMTKKMQAAAFGEILWDILPDKKCLGGAPLNCGAHLNRLGFKTSMISSLGNDELGKKALDAVKKEKVNTDFIQVLPGIPTGFTQVTLENGIPSYEFNAPCAWDCISLSHEQFSAFFKQHWNVFCFGSLAQRSDMSRNTLLNILRDIQADIIFFDVNLRKAFFNRNIIEGSLQHTDILKMNDEEIPVLSKLLGYNCSDDVFIRRIINDFKLTGVVTTLGKKGCAAYFNDTIYTRKPSPVPVVDTVGAGDSFSAAFLASYVYTGGDVQKAIEAGTRMADFVVSHSGALPAYDKALKEALAPCMEQA